MTAKLEALLDKMKALEIEIVDELQKQQEIAHYEILKHRIHFEKDIIIRHQLLIKEISRFIFDAPLKHIVSAPFIWICIVPFLLLDFFISLYQLVCFPIYDIPKVNRQEYIVFDRQYLNYLNIIEKFNCGYCSYANGLIAYVQEIAARTEQFWCPIKHAKHIKNLHSRYYKFINYGDAEAYRNKINISRHDFKDLE